MELINSQLFEFGVLFACGLTLGMLFQLYEFFLVPGERKGNTGKVFVFAGDVLFFFVAGFIACAFWYFSSFGRISIHEILAIILGLAMWRLLFYYKFSKPFGAICVIMLIVYYLGM